MGNILEIQIWTYCTRLNVVRSQSSATFVEELSRRFDDAIMRGQKPTLLHFGDLDPSGVAIPKAGQKNFERRHGIDVEVRHVALTPDQVVKYNLLISLGAVKKKDPNYSAWMKEFGPAQLAVELDALPPDVLHHILKTELEAVYNTDGMNAEGSTEIEERRILTKIHHDVLHLTGTLRDYIMTFKFFAHHIHEATLSLPALGTARNTSILEPTKKRKSFTSHRHGGAFGHGS